MPPAAAAAAPPATAHAPPAPPTPAAAADKAAAAAAAAQTADAPLRPRRKRRAKQWFEEIFDDDYLRTLPFLTPRQTEREAQFIGESLGIPQGGALLDLACGYGRHAMELAAKSYKVTGLDLSLPLLIRAADAARRVGVNVNFIHGDMREMTFENEFDGAYCMFTSFGFFDDDTNRKVAANLARAIKPGGKLLIDVVNRDYIVHDLPTRVWWQGDGCVVLEEVDFNYFSSRVQVQRSIIFEDGRQVEQEISIRAYSLHEIGKVLHHSGFRVTEVSGGLSLRGKFFGANSRQLIVVAEKKVTP
jgi:SAM-dependent methyltransferase